MTWEKHLEHWIVGLRAPWLDWFFIGLSWIGSYGFVDRDGQPARAGTNEDFQLMMP